MTAPVPSNADELVSAYVDGVAAPDEITLVESSDELMARVESMQSLVGQFNEPVTPAADAVREAHLAAALGEFDRLYDSDEGSDEGSGDQATVTPIAAAASSPIDTPLPRPVADEPVAPAGERGTGNVTSLSEARERRRPRGFSAVAAAAAVVALLFAGIVAVGLNRGTTDDVVSEASSAVADSASDAIESADADVMAEAEEEDAMADDADAAPMAQSAGVEAMDDDEAMVESADSGSDAMADAAEDRVGAIDAEGSFADEAESVPVGFLGFFDSIDGLEIAVSEDLGGRDQLEIAVERAAFLPVSNCADVILDYTGVEDPTLLATAFLEGQEIELHGAPDGVTVILDRLGCSILGEFV